VENAIRLNRPQKRCAMRLIGLAALGLILALSLLAADAQQAGKVFRLSVYS